MPWSSNALVCLLALALPADYLQLVSALQQRPQSHVSPQLSPPENSALNSFSEYDQVTGSHVLSTINLKNGKHTAKNPINERALATFAPADSISAVRAHLAGPSQATGVSQLPVRSLQDWQVEDIVLLATVDGKLFARDRISGRPRWELQVDRPMVETVYHQNTTASIDSTHQHLLWIVEPSEAGALYIYAPGPGLGLKELGISVKQLVEELSPYAGDDPPVVYTAEKKNTLYTVDSSNGNILRMFSSAGTVSNDDRTCRKVNALEDTMDRDCEPIGTLSLGRIEYTIAIQDRLTGQPICTLNYFEWSTNVRDRDLQNQYTAALDHRYVDVKHDGTVVGLEDLDPFALDDRSAVTTRHLYTLKFDSPVARVYDVVRPSSDERDHQSNTSLAILPQPLRSFPRSLTANVFLNCTESGSWYALSEWNYPMINAGAAQALCYIDAPDTSVDSADLGRQKTRLTGLHSLLTDSVPASRVRDLSAPRHSVLLPPPPAEEHVRPHSIDAADGSIFSAVSRPSPLTVIFMALTTLFLLAMPLRKKLGIKHKLPWQPHEVQPTLHSLHDSVDNVFPEPATIAKADEPQIRVPEPAQEIVFPNIDSDKHDLTVDTDIDVDQSIDHDGDDTATSPMQATVKATKEKKARRGVRGGRKIKEKLEQAEQRKRANSQTSRKLSSPLDMSKVIDDPAPVQLAPAPVISVAASESPAVVGKIQINNLIIDTDDIIGHGSAGTCVFTGHFEGNEVAVKRMLSQYYELASQEVSFLQQREDHPNVIKYYCQQKDQHFLYIALELCQASLMDLYFPQNTDPSHRERLATLLLSIQQEMPKVLHQLAAGLHHLHSRRIIHRDIKPQNILIAKPKKHETSKGPRLVISDFGLCKTLPENVSTLVDPTGNAGTCGWKAPELISQPKETASASGHSNVSQSSTSDANGQSGGLKRAADIFSLGCLFFWVLTGGCHPFDDKEGWAQIREFNIKKNNLQNMHKLDLGSDTEEPMQLIRAMLQHRPEDRPTSIDVLKHPFFWDASRRLAFLCDVSDHFEREPRDPPSWQLDHLESYASTIIPKDDFLCLLPASFIDTLGRQRKYNGSRLLDLLRALRNKRNHYEDMPDEVKKRVGTLPDGYLQFWTARFPKLLMACYYIVKECKVERSDRFRGYFGIEE